MALLLGALCSAPAGAAISDTIHPFAAYSYNYDDNLFRLADAAGSQEGRSDTSKQAQAGVAFSRPVGRQVFSGQAKVSRVSFDRYEQLNYTGKDLSADWEWHLANHLEGHMGSSYAQTLTSFADFHSNERNLRTQRRNYIDGAWRFHPSWRLRGSFSREKFNFDLASQRVNDRVEDVSEAGVDYLASSGSRVGLVARHIKGSYPFHRRFAGIDIDDGFQQDEFKANVFWTLGGVTQVQLLGGWARRKHNFFTERDASGLNGRGYVYWKPMSKLKFTAGAWREFAAVESTFVDSSLNKGVSLAVSYDISPKLRADASVKRERRDFSKISGLSLPGDPTDSTRTANAGLVYAPLPAVQFGVNAFHDQRNGSPFLGTGAYRANGMSVSLSAQF